MTTFTRTVVGTIDFVTGLILSTVVDDLEAHDPIFDEEL